MTKFEIVKTMLEKQTKRSGNWLTVISVTNSHSKPVYRVKGVLSNKIVPIRFRSLQEIIERYNLNANITKKVYKTV